jgi:high affinity sulfate transporter 1
MAPGKSRPAASGTVPLPDPVDGADPSGPTRAWPVAGWLRGYRRARLAPDSIGALTAWALIVPECVAYAQIAGVPVQNAFYAAPVALIAYALFGTSRFLIVGATSAAAVLSGATVSGLSADPGKLAVLSAALALIAGAVLIIAGLARLGFLADFLAEPALIGFLFGMALTIAVRQLAKLVGVSSGEGGFFRRLAHILRLLPHWSLTTIAVGAGALAALLLLERYIPRLPASLLVLAAGIAVSAAGKLERHGVEIVGKIPRAVPTPSWPALPWHDWVTLGGGAAGVALVVFAESFSISSGFARDADDHAPDASREMIAMGASNAAVGLFRGFAVSGSASRSAAAKAAGAASPMTSVVAAVIVLLTGAFLTPLFTDLPEPVLGAIVVVAIRSFFNVAALRRYRHADRRSFAIAATALLGVMIFDLLPGLLLAVVLSLALYIAAASHPRLAMLGRIHGTDAFGDLGERENTRPVPGMLAVRPDAALFFGNIGRITREIAELGTAPPHPRVIVLDLGSSYRLSLPVLDELEHLRTQLAQADIELWIARVRASVQPQLEASPLGSAIGPHHAFLNVTSAATYFEQHL